MFIYLITAPLNEVYQYNVWGRDVHSAAYAFTSEVLVTTTFFEEILFYWTNMCLIHILKDWITLFLLNQTILNTFFKGLNHYFVIEEFFLLNPICVKRNILKD